MIKLHEVYRMLKGLDQATFSKVVGLFPFQIEAAPDKHLFKGIVQD